MPTLQLPKNNILNSLRGRRPPLMPEENDPILAGGGSVDTMLGGDPVPVLSPEELELIGATATPDLPTATTAPNPPPGETAAGPPSGKPVPEVTPPAITPLGDTMGESKAEGALLIKWLSDNHILDDKELALAKLGLDMPAETAARIQVGKSFLDQYPDLRYMIEKGAVTGLGDYVAGKVNPQSDSASVQRKLNSGVRAMRYMLSGATLGKEEGAEYGADYQPAFLDSNVSLMDKTDQLAREMQYAMRGLAMGRGGMELINDLNAGKASEFNPDNEFMTSRPPAGEADPDDPSGLSDEELMKRLMGQK
jgi:hypothetical protein